MFFNFLNKAKQVILDDKKIIALEDIYLKKKYSSYSRLTDLSSNL